MKTLSSLYVICLLLAACASPNMPSVQESIAAGYVTVETLADSVYAANQSGQMSDSNRSVARVILQQAKHALDLAASFVDSGDNAQAVTQITQAFSYFETVRSLLEDGQ